MSERRDRRWSDTFHQNIGEGWTSTTISNLKRLEEKAKKADRYEKALREIVVEREYLGHKSYKCNTEMVAIATDALSAVFPDESGLEGK